MPIERFSCRYLNMLELLLLNFFVILLVRRSFPDLFGSFYFYGLVHFGRWVVVREM